ncbi:MULTISPECIES: SHOCT domain-containing protein [Bacillaceae]|uniref:SHOCT domain-containing protein n=1 Tax=Bacillaceae TaxID=186817 RepID=UPI001C874AA9|nr:MULTISPECIES: hypothetical protein [Bacillaceae]
MHHFGFFPWFVFPIFFILIAIFVTNLILLRKNGQWYRSGSYNAMEMLEKRYVSGEIDETEFKRIKENLK